MSHQNFRSKTGSITNSSRILVTGANGYIGTHITKVLLQAGYSVKAAVRSMASSEAIIRSHPEYEDRLSFAIVPDITISGAYDEAVKDVDGVSSNFRRINR